MTAGPAGRHLFWSAGEASGDHHAAEIIQRIREILPQLSHVGLGGEAMERSGMELRVNMARDYAIIGFTRALIAYPKLRAILKSTVAQWKQNPPDALVCVDYPGFNLPLAREAHRLRIPVYWYISPQVWAWREGRVAAMKAHLRKVFVILPFEEDFLRKRGVSAQYVGNPLLDELPADLAPQAAARATFGFTENDLVIGLLPGSRTREILRHMPLLIETARIICQARPEVQFLLPIAPTVDGHQIQVAIGQAKDCPITTTTDIAKARLSFNAALCKSGTSTLELALSGVPMIVFYITSWLNARIIRTFLKIPDIGLVNLVAGKRICPEIVQEDATPEKLANALLTILPGQTDHSGQIDALSEVRKRLGGPGCSDRVAEAIIADMKSFQYATSG